MKCNRRGCRNHHDGFGLMEVLVAVTIVGILATLAIPGMLNRRVMDEIASAMLLADLAKTPVAASWAATQSFPADNAAAALPPADRIVNNYVRAVAVQDGAISITFGNKANSAIDGKTLTLRPAVVEDAPVVPVTWVCGNATAPDKMTIKGDNRTDVPDAYLPYACRGPGR
jgi:type IV pilus assembly protein PilA